LNFLKTRFSPRSQTVSNFQTVYSIFHSLYYSCPVTLYTYLFWSIQQWSSCWPNLFFILSFINKRWCCYYPVRWYYFQATKTNAITNSSNFVLVNYIEVNASFDPLAWWRWTICTWFQSLFLVIHWEKPWSNIASSLHLLIYYKAPFL